MPNTVIALKKSSTPSSIPSNLANGELAINYADGKLYYKAANGTIASISGNEPNYFGTVNANSTLVIADTPGDVLTLVPGNNISIVGDAVNDKVTIALKDNVSISGTINATAVLVNGTPVGSGGGGAYYSGNNGDVGSASGLGDIFRVHTNTLNANVTIYSGNNALAAGPITVASGKVLTIQANARIAIV